jgi:hypothetical protein
MPNVSGEQLREKNGERSATMISSSFRWEPESNLRVPPFHDGCSTRELGLKPSAKDKSPLVTLSVDAFNLLNHVNFLNYLGALRSPFFGQATGSQPARRLQLALRFQF